MNDRTIAAAIIGLKGCLNTAPSDPALSTIIGAKQKVLQKYSALFSPSALEQLRAEDFRSFLYLENNFHWSQLYRRGLEAAEDMEILKKGLSVLVDEGRPLAERWNAVQVRGLGKAVQSAILLVTYPDRYGVWNGVSERALKQFGIFPEVFPKKNKGKMYEAVNNQLGELSRAVGTDLWTLDGLWWAMDPDRNPRLTEKLAQIS